MKYRISPIWIGTLVVVTTFLILPEIVSAQVLRRQPVQTRQQVLPSPQHQGGQVATPYPQQGTNPYSNPAIRRQPGQRLANAGILANEILNAVNQASNTSNQGGNSSGQSGSTSGSSNTGPISTDGKEIVISERSLQNSASKDSESKASYKILQRDDTYSLQVHHWAKRSSMSGTTKSTYLFVVVDRNGKNLWQYNHGHSVGAKFPEGIARKEHNEFVPIPSSVGRAIRRSDAVVGFTVACNKSEGVTAKEIRDQLSKLGVPYVDQINIR